MEKICLDFEAALDFLRGEPTTLEKLKYYVSREEICVTSFTLFNLAQVVRKSEILNVLASRVTVLAFDRQSAQLAGIICRELEEHGERSKRLEDIITAAVCVRNNAFLFSRVTGKYDGIKGLKKV